MTALGWIKAGQACPPSLHQFPIGGLNVLGLPPRQADAPRDIIAAQVQYFDAGYDILPTSPVAKMSIAQACDAADRNQTTLADKIARYNGVGQLSIVLHNNQTQSEQSHYATGRAWLLSRQKMQIAKEHYRALLRSLVSDLGIDTSNPTRSGAGYRIDILVERVRAKEVEHIISARAALTDATDATVTVTGLWPPYCFVGTLPNACDPR